MYTPYQPYPFIFTMPPQQQPQEPARKVSKNELKEIKKAIKFYQSILDEEKKKGEEKKKKEDENKKKPGMGKVETFFLLTFASPFIGVAYLYAIRSMLDWMQAVIH